MAGARRNLAIPEDRLGNPGFAVLQGDTPYLISPYAREIAEIDDRERLARREAPELAVP